MKMLLSNIFFTLLFSTFINAQSNIELTFSAMFDSSSVKLDSVYIQNFTQGSDTMLFFPDTVLTLGTTVGTYNDYKNNSLIVRNYPNPFFEQTYVDIFLENKDQVSISLFDISGRKLNEFNAHLDKGKHSFSIEGGQNSLLFLNVETFNNGSKTLKMLSMGNNSKCVKIEYLSSEQFIETRNKSKSFFLWSPGDQLKFFGFSTINGDMQASDYISDNPANSQNYEFSIKHGKLCISEPFINDTRDGNIYRTVQIGNQCWMAENLKYLPSVVGPVTGSTTVPRFYVIGYNGTDTSVAKASANYLKHGVLYNWIAAMDSMDFSNDNPSGVMGVCPTGWHIPSSSEWDQMRDFLIANEYNFDGTTSGNKIAKALAVNSDWVLSGVNGSPGKDMHLNNKVGFSAYPGAARSTNGNFLSINQSVYWWTASDYGSNRVARTLYWDYVYLETYSYNRGFGMYVRCVKD